MSDSEEEETVPFVPFAKREEWKDVTPVKQDDGPNPICAIAYSSQYTEVMDYFRAILQKDERSERAFSLTSEVIQQNPANYTAWYFRRILLSELKKDLAQELQFVTKIGHSNPKNYQIWYHRKAVVERLNDFSEELKFTAQEIDSDSKNYHAWAHRQWVVETNALWDSELDYIDSLLKQDMRNNSAWNQRFFCVTKNKTANISDEIRSREVKYAIEWIKKAPNNQSPWAYLKGIYTYNNHPYDEELKKLCLELKEKYLACPHPSSLLVDIYEQEGSKESVQKAIELCSTLETTLDAVHKKYWSYRKNELANKP